MSVSQIRAVFDRITRGQFADLTDDVINGEIADSQDYADEEVLGSTKYREAVACRAAHLLSSSGPTAGGGGSGPVKRKRNGPREVEYFETARPGSSYSTTGYGQRYEQILADVAVPFEVI